jgi:hypothetical protein
MLNIKDKSKMSFLFQLTNQLDFVEIAEKRKHANLKKTDFFSFAGLWQDRDIDARELRKKAWRKEK